MGAQQQEPSRAEAISIGIVIFFMAAGLVALFVALAVDLARTAGSTDPVYTVAITGAAGLDRPTLSPVFNLTVRIDNTGNKLEEACVGSFSAAAVSYGDALLTRGSVPPTRRFALGEQESERAATAWGLDVVVWLAEELDLDVQVTTPVGRSRYDTAVVNLGFIVRVVQ